MQEQPLMSCIRLGYSKITNCAIYVLLRYQNAQINTLPKRVELRTAIRRQRYYLLLIIKPLHHELRTQITFEAY